MKKEELIKKLQELPCEDVCIFDHRKNTHHADVEPQGIGIEPNFDIEYHEEDVNMPFVGLTFNNDDYNDNGNCVNTSILDSDISTIEAIHDLLLETHGYSLNSPILKRARELTSKLYENHKRGS